LDPVRWHPALEAQLAVEPHHAHAGFGFGVLIDGVDRPLNISGQPEKRTVHQHRFIQQRHQLRIFCGAVGAFVKPRQIFAQISNQFPQMGRIKQLVGIRQGAAANRIDIQILIDPRHLAGILDEPQRPEHGIEKRGEITDNHIIVEQHAVVMTGTTLNGAYGSDNCFTLSDLAEVRCRLLPHLRRY
jgi:hypothetical protein